MRIPKPVRVGLSTGILLIGLLGSGKSIYRGIQNTNEAGACKTGGVERVLDIKDNVLPDLGDRDFYLTHRQDLQEYDSLLADTTTMGNLGRYETHDRNATRSLGVSLPLYLLVSFIGGLGAYIEIPSYLAQRRQRKKQMEGKGRRA